MDMLNKAKGALSGGNKTHSQQAGGQSQDYVDKGLAAVQKRMGMKSNPGTNEKFTDAGRSAYEKATGSKVSDKVCATPWEHCSSTCGEKQS